MSITLYHWDREKLTQDEIYEVSLGSRRAADPELHARLMAEGKYVAVAKWDGDQLDDAYKATQNGVLTDSWTLAPPEGLTPLVEPIEHGGKRYGHRTTSIGDVFVMDGEMFLVDTFGFKEIGLMPGGGAKP